MEGLVVPGENEEDLDAPLTEEEEALIERREPVEDALLHAEAAAAQAGETALASCLSRLQLLWDLGQEEHALRLLDKARDAVIAALKAAGLDEEADPGAG
jgi:hypothetical protein